MVPLDDWEVVAELVAELVADVDAEDVTDVVPELDADDVAEVVAELVTVEDCVVTSHPQNSALFCTLISSLRASANS